MCLRMVRPDSFGRQITEMRCGWRTRLIRYPTSSDGEGMVGGGGFSAWGELVNLLTPDVGVIGLGAAIA